eukprot:3610415-Prorocentrum_lima.AAC.1
MVSETRSLSPLANKGEVGSSKSPSSPSTSLPPLREDVHTIWTQITYRALLSQTPSAVQRVSRGKYHTPSPH